MNELALNFITDYIITTDVNFLNEVNEELYNSEYVVIPFSVTNTGVTYEEAIFINDLEEKHYSDETQIFSVVDLTRFEDEINEAIADRLSREAQADTDEAETLAHSRINEEARVMKLELKEDYATITIEANTPFKMLLALSQMQPFKGTDLETIKWLMRDTPTKDINGATFFILNDGASLFKVVECDGYIIAREINDKYLITRIIGA